MRAAARPSERGAVATTHGERKEEDGGGQRLTAGRRRRPAGSGTRRSGSTVAGDLGDPRRKKTSGRRFEALLVTWLGGDGVWVNGELEVTSEGHEEGCGHGGARRQSRRPRTERREEAEEGMRAKESERRSGELCGVVQKHSGKQAERRWRSEGTRAASTRSASY